MKKTLILSLIVIASVGLIYALAYYIRMDTFSFAWALNFLLMLCVMVFTEALKSPLVSTYYHEKAWEGKGKTYENLGVNFYRKLLVLTGWERLNKKANPVEKSTKALMHLHLQTKKSEFSHLIIFLIVLGFNVFVVYKYGVLQSLWLFILNILLNLYPIFLQRYNRPRFERAISLSNRRQGKL